MLISIAGPGNTVSRHERQKVPTSVKLRGGNNIPHGVYDVKPNLAQFDEWTFEVIKMAKLREPMAETTR